MDHSFLEELDDFLTDALNSAAVDRSTIFNEENIFAAIDEMVLAAISPVDNKIVKEEKVVEKKELNVQPVKLKTKRKRKPFVRPRILKRKKSDTDKNTNNKVTEEPKSPVKSSEKEGVNVPVKVVSPKIIKKTEVMCPITQTSKAVYAVNSKEMDQSHDTILSIEEAVKTRHKKETSKSSNKDESANRAQSTMIHCLMCPLRFPNRNMLYSHVEKVHPNRDYTCEECHANFPHKFLLILHKKVHNQSSDVVCDLCNFKFKHRNHLLHHTKVHTGERPYACTLCSQRFFRKDYLTTHMTREHK